MSGRRRAAGPLLVILLSSIALAILDASGQAFWQGFAINLGIFGSARITFRLPDALKGRIEAAAAAQHLSVNTWLVRAASQALDSPSGAPRPPFSKRGPGQRITGYARS